MANLFDHFLSFGIRREVVEEAANIDDRDLMERHENREKPRLRGTDLMMEDPVWRTSDSQNKSCPKLITIQNTDVDLVEQTHIYPGITCPKQINVVLVLALGQSRVFGQRIALIFIGQPLRRYLYWFSLLGFV